jgi:hypothetical protein
MSSTGLAGNPLILARCGPCADLGEANPQEPNVTNQSQGTENFEPGFLNLAQSPRQGLLREYLEFLRSTKKWWLTPIIIVLLLFGALLTISGGIAGSVLYTLF